MSAFLLIRAVSDRTAATAKADKALAEALTRSDPVLAREMSAAGLSSDEARELHDLGGAPDALVRVCIALGRPDANVFAMGLEVDGDHGEGTRILTATETATASAALRSVTLLQLDGAVRAALRAALGYEPPRDPFRSPFPAGAVDALANMWERLRDIVHDAHGRTFGLAIHIAL